MKDIIVIVGPTGIGKTKLSIELAKRLDAEIINGDSVSIYKDLDIGSAKPTIEEREGKSECRRWIEFLPRMEKWQHDKEIVCKLDKRWREWMILESW